MVVFNGFIFSRHNDLAGGVTRYTCTSRPSCRAAAYVQDGDVVRVVGQHPHDTHHGSKAAKNVVWQIRQKATSEADPPSRIVSSVLDAAPSLNVEDQDLLPTVYPEISGSRTT